MRFSKKVMKGILYPSTPTLFQSESNSRPQAHWRPRKGPARLTLPNAFRWIYIVLNKDAQHQKCVDKGGRKDSAMPTLDKAKAWVGERHNKEKERKKRVLSVGFVVFYPGRGTDCWRVVLL